ncbi:MAG TPA: 50S ribosomal protein L25 [Actinomycetota bacterium]|jgi:large subunit ribosomal protein L25
MEATLKAEHRDGTGKGAARKLRAQGRVPGILYGSGVESTPIHVSSQDLIHVFHQGASLVDLEYDGQVHLTIPREVQRDHIRGRFIHIDFLAVRRDEKVTLNIEVRETGEAAGVKTGGVIEHHLREVEIECLPSDVPELIEVDVSALEIGDMIRVRDVVAPAGVTVLTDPDTPVISVITPAALRTEADLTLPGEEAPEEVPEEEAEGAAAAEGEAPAEGGGEQAADEGGEG